MLLGFHTRVRDDYNAQRILVRQNVNWISEFVPEEEGVQTRSVHSFFLFLHCHSATWQALFHSGPLIVYRSVLLSGEVLVRPPQFSVSNARHLFLLLDEN